MEAVADKLVVDGYDETPVEREVRPLEELGMKS